MKQYDSLLYNSNSDYEYEEWSMIDRLLRYYNVSNKAWELVVDHKQAWHQDIFEELYHDK